MGVIGSENLVAVNGYQMGIGYDYVVYDGPVVIDTNNPFAVADWFSSTEDTRPALIVVKGDLTVAAGQVMMPDVRKLGCYILVQGALYLDGEISMTRRGCNHSGLGNSAFAERFAARPIRLFDGLLDGLLNPEIAAQGGLGGYREAGGLTVVPSPSPTIGPGGGGFPNANIIGDRKAGADGTSFSGGAGGGEAEDGYADGGPGGGATVSIRGTGAGNPTPNLTGGGQSGTGGVLVIYVTGTVYGSGLLSANGAQGSNQNVRYGGGSGGGVVILACAVNDSTVDVEANGGLGGGSGASAGGLGTALILEGLGA